ncbi:MAG: hypothetical protein F6K50_03490 [Moorea sp. SIO3I7]|uniref:hypothetical protein n=1 Tax=Moorena sp. SIO3I8 TaxID=2607833 RepID=UPI0013BFBF53|nr:hypothetical protein [Moorena sp. SIO3I8]NEN94622.1 hypothetical protein [Moorena sp. SIO3I7]NEO08677.1 hypothetical protein [Moorena sp. SIO3I8]
MSLKLLDPVVRYCPIPDSLLPIPYSLFPIPCSLNKKNSVKFWLIPMLDRIIFCNSQEP